MAKDIKLYRFSRGEKFQCIVRIVEGLVIYDQVIYPPTTSNEVVLRLMDDAEKEVLKLYNKEI